jgi:hypothetical protein
MLYNVVRTPGGSSRVSSKKIRLLEAGGVIYHRRKLHLPRSSKLIVTKTMSFGRDMPPFFFDGLFNGEGRDLR